MELIVTEKMRTRFAPSPTGSLHVGGARTALFNWLLAKRMGGTFVLRIDDTDPERSTEADIDGLLDDLAWLGMEWDEGPDVGGESGPYKQSERVSLYSNYAERLVCSGDAYRCYCPRERLEELKEKQQAEGRPPRYDRYCLKQFEQGAPPPEGITPTIRFRVPERTIVVKDTLRGQISFRTKDIADFIIEGSDGIATYNFASAIDDALMEITDVVRGEDHLSNTPRQILIMQALDFTIPRYLHLPLIVGPDRKPLSKRHGGCTVRELREEGYFSGAVVNTLIRLGWSPKEGYLTTDEMVVSFQTERLSKSPAVFDPKALNRYNRELIKDLGPEDILDLVEDDFEGPGRDHLITIIRALKDDVNSIGEISRTAKSFIGELELTPEAKKLLKSHTSKMILKAFVEEVERAGEMNEEEYRAIAKRLKFSIGAPGQKLFMPIRVALTGTEKGLELEKIACILGKKKVLERARRAIS